MESELDEYRGQSAFLIRSSDREGFHGRTDWHRTSGGRWRCSGRSEAPFRTRGGRSQSGSLRTLSLAACFLVARHLTSASWPLEEANVVFVFFAGSAYLTSFVFRALGWHRVFPSPQRPDRARCLAACGASAASGTILPFRLDYLVKIATLRHLRGLPLGLETIVLSILTLGLVDAMAMLPLAIAAISTSGSLFLAPLAVVIVWCIGSIGILMAGPRLIRLPLIRRWQRTRAICQRLGESASITRSTFVAGGFLFGCWTSRALGSVFLHGARHRILTDARAHSLPGRRGRYRADHSWRGSGEHGRYCRDPVCPGRVQGRRDQLPLRPPCCSRSRR